MCRSPDRQRALKHAAGKLGDGWSCCKLARETRTLGWRDACANSLPGGFTSYIELESANCSECAVTVAGLLQIEDYARAVSRAGLTAGTFRIPEFREPCEPAIASAPAMTGNLAIGNDAEVYRYTQTRKCDMNADSSPAGSRDSQRPADGNGSEGHQAGHSPSDSNCVEVTVTYDTSGAGHKAGGEKLYLMRDSRNPDGPVLAFTPAEWEAFILGVKDGEFDITP